MKIQAFDPGETTGYALLEDGKPTSFANCSLEDLKDFLDANLRPTYTSTVVIEDYRIRFDPKNRQAQKSHAWSKGMTLRVIGMIDFWAFLNGFPVVYQQPSVKPMAYKAMGMDYEEWKKKPNHHYMDAIVHGNHFYRKWLNDPRSS